MTARTTSGKRHLASLLSAASLSLAPIVALSVSGVELCAAQTPPAPHDPAVAAAVAKVRAWYTASAGEGTLRLDDWKFHKGDTPDGASPTLDTSTWGDIHVGDEWGPENSVAWFRRDVVIPTTIAGAPAAGGKVILNLAVDDDGVAFVDGRQVQAFHWDEGHVVLSDHARPGAHYLVAVKGINGPGTGRLFRADLTLSGLPTPRASAENYLDSETFTTWMEGDAPQLAPGLAEQERRAAAEIPQGPLAAVDPRTLTTDLDRAASDLADPAARRITDNLVGYAHTDIDWLWQWPETKDVWYHNGMTLLGLMKEYPDLHFSQSQAVMYQAMQQEHPELFAGIQAAVRAGKWEPLNGWCENDMNMPSGESEIRQAMLSNEYYKSEFGVTSSICWRPDSFGHAWTLPMILKGTGVDSYYFCRAGHGVPVFWWQSPDGSRILAFNDPGWYNASILPSTPQFILQQTARTREPEWMTVYGVGDHGGGPTRADINEAHRLNSLPAMPHLQLTSAADAFRRLRKAEPPGGYPVISDELNPTFQGCYTSHVDTKRMNRTLEQTLYSAEAWSSVASLMGHPYPAATLRDAWYDTLRNQFHDIMAGSNIHPSYLFALQRDAIALERAESSRSGAIETIDSAIDTNRQPGSPLVVFNPCAWSRTDVVRVDVPNLATGSGTVTLLDADGARTVASASDAGGGKTALRFVATAVPAAGYRVYWIQPGEPTSVPEQPGTAGTGVIQNEYYRVSYDAARGVISGIYDKIHRRELVAPGGAADRMDVLWEGGGNAWDLGSIQSTTPASMSAPPVARTASDGSESVTFTDRYDKSTLVHTVTLRPGIPRVDFRLDMDWREQHTARGGAFLKTTFDAALGHPEAWWEIPFGAIHRPAGGEEGVGLRWIDVDETVQSKAQGAATTVNLSPYWNGDAFSTTENHHKGSFDDQGMSYPVSTIPAAGLTTLSGIPYLLPDPNSTGNQVIAKGQTVALPPNEGGDLYVLGAATNGSDTASLALRYRDGKNESVSLPLSDWVVNSLAQSSVLESTGRFTPDAGDTQHAHIWAVRVPVPNTGSLASLTLPVDPHIHIFAITLGPRVAERSTFGVALLNDGRYGSDISGATMRMSVIRSAGDPDPIFDVGRHTLRYALYAHGGGWQSSDLAKAAWEFNTPLEARLVSAHPGGLPPAGSFLKVEGRSIVTTAIKQSEDGRALIVRFYNASAAPSRATVRFTLPRPVAAVHLADMKETPGAAVRRSGQSVEVPIGAWSSVTLRVSF